MARGQHPFQRNAGHHGLETQGAAFVGLWQEAACLDAPGLALRRRNGRHCSRQLGGRLLQRHCQHIALRGQTGTIEQGAGSEGVACHIPGQIIALRHKGGELAGPVARGFKAGRKSVGVVQGPVTLRPWHELGIGNQHHRARRMGRQPVQVRLHLCQHAQPQRRALIAFRYDCHSVARPGHTGERGIGFCHNAQTLNVHRSQPAQNQGIRNGQRTHQTSL